MSELAIEFAGLEMKNPLIVASSELTNTVSKIKEFEDFIKMMRAILGLQPS